MKLRVYLKQIENTVIMRILEQEGNFVETTQVKIDQQVGLYTSHIHLRGKSKQANHLTVCRSFNKNITAYKYKKKVIEWLTTFMECQDAYKEPERGDFVHVSDGERIFVTKIEGAKKPFVCVAQIDELEFCNNAPFDTANWQSIAAIRKTVKHTFIGDIYEWEL